MPAQSLPAGKLPLSLLEKLLHDFAPRDPRIVVGPRAGEDAAVFDLGDLYLVAKTDPITFATNEIGWYAVNINANDVAVMGAQPRWFLATVLLPEGLATDGMAESIFGQVYEACDTLGISLAGGHTEITVGLDRPIVCGVMLGEVAPNSLITTAGAQMGDVVLLVKQVPIEGTALIALEREAVLRSRGYPDPLIARAQGLLRDPGISVVTPALLAASTGKVHAMHDPTEGGLMTGLLEMSRAAATGLEVDLDVIPLLPEGRALCREFNLDPLGTLASGAIVMAVPPEAVDLVYVRLTEAGYPVTAIGRITAPAEGLVACRSGVQVEWPTYAADEITKLFG